MAPHSIVRPPRHIGQQLAETLYIGRSGKMTTSGTLELGDVAEVVLGVDTHLDFHVAVVLDHLGRTPMRLPPSR